MLTCLFAKCKLLIHKTGFTTISGEMLKIIVETGSYVWLVAGFRSGHSWLKFTLPKIALFFDKIYCFGELSRIDQLEKKPYGQFSSEITGEISKLLPTYPPPSDDQLEDLRIALGDSPGGEGGHYAYFGTRALLDVAKEKSCYLYVLPGLREGFIKFCLKYESDYLSLIKESFLLCDILEYIFDQQIPAFDPIKSAEILIHFADYKEDFQKGMLNYLNLFKGGYMLSKDQKKYLKENLANDEKRLLDFLQPENLRKYNIPILGLAGEGLEEALSWLLGVSTPVGILIDIGKEIKKVRDFKKSNLDFILSLVVLKKLANVGKIERTVDCAVCALSPAEIEDMTEKECFDIMYRRELCMEHKVARLDLHKRFGLFGKELLIQMKRLGNSSIFIEPRKRKER